MNAALAGISKQVLVQHQKVYTRGPAGKTSPARWQDWYNGNSSMSEPKPILVTAGIIIREHEILICQRHRSDPYGLEWEFPGGKVKDSEGLEAALRRELREELGIEAEIGEEVYRLRHRYPDRYVEVIFFRVESYRGKPANRVFESIEWVERRELAGYNFLEADRELVGRIAEGAIV